MACCGEILSLGMARLRRASSCLAACSVSLRLDASLFISSSADRSSLSKSAVHGSCTLNVDVELFVLRILCTGERTEGFVREVTGLGRSGPALAGVSFSCLGLL